MTKVFTRGFGFVGYIGNETVPCVKVKRISAVCRHLKCKFEENDKENDKPWTEHKMCQEVIEIIHKENTLLAT